MYKIYIKFGLVTIAQMLHIRIFTQILPDMTYFKVVYIYYVVVIYICLLYINNNGCKRTCIDAVHRSRKISFKNDYRF